MKICPVCKTEFDGGEVFCPNDGARLGTPSQMAPPQSAERADPLIGYTLDGRYRILRRIGEGGMGIVYEAEHAVIEKRVALKVLRDDFSSRPEVVQRFRQEAKSASRIGNEHIVDISDFGETPSGASYFVMEMLDGEDLANLLAREGSLPLARAADIVIQCCKALGAAHAKGIVHRDMKPENIFLVTRDGRPDFVKIVDFGIAKMSDIETPGEPGRKLTKTGMIFGTPEYMSPEQAAGKPLDHRVDVYALGVILFELLTGRVPFVGDTFMGILTQHMFESPPPMREVNPNVKVEPAVEGFIARALAKSADERFPSCDEMARSLEAVLRGEVGAGQTLHGFGEPVKYKPKAPRVVVPEPASAEFPAAAVEPQKKQGSSLVIGLAAGIVIALGGGAVAVWAMGNGGDTTTPVTAGPGTTVVAIAQIDSGVPEPAVVDSGAPTTVAVDSGAQELTPMPARVSVRVSTTPNDGARVWVVGDGDVCQETPCTFDAVATRTITVRARRGRAEGELEITPTGPMEIEIPLAMPRTKVHQTHEEEGTGGTGHGDLKIPDVFRHPR